MAQIRAIEARGLLDDIAQGAKSAAADLIEAIRAAKKSVLTPNFKNGRIYVSSSGSGNSQSFLIPTEWTAHYEPTRVAAQYQEFIEIYYDCVAAGLITDATDVDSDLAAMLGDDRLQTVTRRQVDVSSIRVPGYGGLTA